jgi:aspartyl-tRNA(Asn)/glutamyl-tRNA(Gln) amidotransferase subunit B
MLATLPYRIVIGLEVHVQLLTRTKLFCGCSTRFGLPPNSATCPVCIGLPGVLPVMNRRAFELALRAALALNCRIAPFTKWDRKNYYYPDLPKNYQISQYDLPFSKDGWLEVETPAGPKKVGIIRVHLEEDAGKMLHDEQGTGKDSLVDLNRAGTPLLEIVSQPDLSSPEEAKAYLEEIRLLLREIGVSDCEMQEGSLRCDANVNIHVPRPDGPVAATPIVEVKNLNSFRAVERAMRYEAQRQYEEFLRNADYRLGRVSKETAGWDEDRGVTLFQRRKEEASDYRYFPEPDLVPVVVDDAWLERTRAEMGELPAALRVRLGRDYHLSPYDAGVLTSQGRAVVAYFEEAARASGDPKAAANWVTNQVLATLREQKLDDIRQFKLAPAALAELIVQQKSSGMPKQTAGEVYARMLEAGCTAREAIGQLGIKEVGAGDLAEIVRRAIAGNPKAVADFKKGKAAAANAIKGAVMRETRGTARPDLVQQILMEELQKA